MAILLVLISYATPFAKSFIDGQRKIALINSMVSTLHFARSEAIKRGSDVVVCKSADGHSCITSGEWEQGWVVFEDFDGDRSHDLDEALLAQRGSLTGVTVYYRAFGSNHYIVYRPQGITKTNGTFTFCDSAGSASARALIIFKTGRVRSSRTRSDGSALTCPP